MKRLRIRLLLLAGFLLVFPFFLRRRPRVERRITILAPPESIFPLVNDLRLWVSWTEWGRREDFEYSYGDYSAGEGATQAWTNDRTSGELRIVRSEAPGRVDYELEMHGWSQLFGRILLQRDGTCTRVVWRCVWERAENPYRRYFDLLFQRMIGRDFDAGLKRLKALVEAEQREILTRR